VFRAGQNIGLYTLIVKLGRGGFGEVWLAEKRSQFVTKRVAVKLPHDEQVNFDAIRQEATLWEQASGHPNVLPIIDADVYDGQVVIVSEYADGGSLADRLKREDKPSIQQSVELAIGILSGLEFLHSRKIIHRDVKPQNILLQGNTPRLADFGISRAMNTTVVSSTIIGTDAYMSPESFDGARNAQTDIWSVGVVLYQMLKGALPFPQEHPSERMFAVLTKEFAPLSSELPSDLRLIVQKALAKQPEERYWSAEHMREDLQKALIGIAHPTFAKTEVLIKPDLREYETNAPTIDNKNQIDKAEAKTITNDSPAIHPPLINNQHFNEPAPTQAAFTSPHSVVTELKQTPAAENNSASINLESVNKGFAAKSNFNTNIYAPVIGIAAIIGLSLLAMALFSSYSAKQANSSNTNSTKLLPMANPYASINTDLDKFQEGSKYGYKNRKGEIIIPPKYEEANYFTEGFAPVKLNDKWAFIDDKDKPLTSFKYDYAWNFSEGIAFAKLGKQWGAIDRTGKEIIPFIYEEGSIFSEGLAPVKLNGKVGYIDKTGKEIIPFKYYQAFFFKSGLTSACIGDFYKGECAVIDETGKEITPYKYDYISDFYNDLASVALNKKFGFIDKTGKEVIPVKYDEVGIFDQTNTCVVQRDGRKFRIDKSGNETDIGAATPTPGITYTSNTNTSSANSNSAH
jgi:serine/threonine protein kinase